MPPAPLDVDLVSEAMKPNFLGQVAWPILQAKRSHTTVCNRISLVMSARAAFGRAVMAAGGTMLVLGGATVGLSAVSMAVSRAVIMRNKKQHLIACRACSGREKVPCDVCNGERMLRYHPVKSPPIGLKATHCVCCMCDGTGEQVCLNCVGEGTVMPLPNGLQDRVNWLQIDIGEPAVSPPPQK